MRKSVLPTRFQQLDARVLELQRAFDIQEQRIAQMQAELDALPEARKRRRSLRALLEHQHSQNGNSRSHR
jgi:septal ring factor EnvC (AmiA/AmiB activator)